MRAHLASERHARRQLRVLPHLQVAHEGRCLRDRVVSVEGGVHVGDGLARHHRRRDHLDEDLNRRCVPHGAVQSADDGKQERGEEKGDDEGPPARSRVSMARRS